MIKINALLIVVTFLCCVSTPAQNIKSEKVLHQNILKTIKKDIEDNYYDEKLRDIDIKENYENASKLIDSAKTVEEMTDIIARFLYVFGDSHLYYLPPPKTVSVDYGWELRLIGDKTFIYKIEEESDAYKKGVRVGDQVYMIEGYIPNRKEFEMMRYHFEVLSPQASLNILLIKPTGGKYKLEIAAKITKDSVFMPSTRELRLKAQKDYAEDTRYFLNDDIENLSILKMTSFGSTPLKINKMMDKVKKNGSLILDLRGNRGGLLISLGEMISNLFDKRIILGRTIERKGNKEIYTDPRDKKNYQGNIVVLVDSESASAAEMLARIIQIEDRGKVIGDQSSGAVMFARTFHHTFGLDSLIPYGISITTANIMMRDGKGLEKIGVTPDELILPTAADLSKNYDPVLARAAEILGFKITSEQAGKIFDKH